MAYQQNLDKILFEPSADDRLFRGDLKKQCLLILPRKIFPVVGGYANHRKNLIEILHRHYRLSIVAISDDRLSPEEQNFFQTHSSYFKYIAIPRWRYLWNAFCAIFTRQPLQVGYFYFHKVQRVVDDLLPRQDIVIGSLCRSMKYLKKAPADCRIVFDMVDSIAINYKRAVEKVSSFFWKLIYQVESGRLLRYEKYWVERAYATMLFNWQECSYWKAHGNACLLPHGVNARLLDYDKTDARYSSSIAFIGKMDYQPNVDAVRWYAENVHSRIGKQVPLIVVGAYPTREIVKLARKYANITVTGFVEDPFVILKSAAAVVAPMQTGAGIQNKVLEAMALGTVNILTPLAARPIEKAVNGEHFLVADSADDFCSVITDVMEHTQKYDKIKQKARDFIRQHYTWQAYEKEYIRIVEGT
ncbi:MAG: glycosyltransferase [Prevotellaceae bacterium]|jgi:glycosyltransferase involved in cell wall biosynthesis|nr:glycosyltransferase [Prevotellaceae bacterium]